MIGPSLWLKSMYSVSPSRPQGPRFSILHPRRLVTPRRWDLAVKARYFRHLLHGGDPDAERVYLWHIEARSGHRMRTHYATDRWKLCLEDYLESAQELLRAMKLGGFDPSRPVPVDPDMELLDGSHRTACALVLGLDVMVRHEERHVWAPAWGEAWFIEKGMKEEDLERLRQDWNVLQSVK